MADLVTLEDYKIYKKLTKTENDEVIAELISGASSMVKAYCGHSFIDYYSTNKVETFNILNNQDCILLNEWPIREVVQVEYKSSYLDTSYTVLETTDYYVDTSIDAVFLHTGYWPVGFGSVKITYKAGYAATPDDVKIATLDLVNHYLKEEYKEKKTIGSVSIDNAVNVKSATKWPPHVARVLDFYKNG